MPTAASTPPAYTPGPWVFDPTNLVVYDAHVKLGVATLEKAEHPDVTSANARLIAAAPELFQALSDLLDVEELNYDEREEGTADAVSKALDVYRKIVAQS